MSFRCTDVTCSCLEHRSCEICDETLPMDNRASVLDDDGYEVWACPACTVGRVIKLWPKTTTERKRS